MLRKIKHCNVQIYQNWGTTAVRRQCYGAFELLVTTLRWRHKCPVYLGRSRGTWLLAPIKLQCRPVSGDYSARRLTRIGDPRSSNCYKGNFGRFLTDSSFGTLTLRKPRMRHSSQFWGVPTIWWGKFSQKHNYKYMAKWWCLLAMQKNYKTWRWPL